MLLLGPLLLGPFLLGLAACGGDPAVESEPEAPRSLPVTTEVVEPERVVDVAHLPADLEPVRRAVLAAEVPGVVEAVHVEDGDSVRAGQRLLEIDARALKQAVAEAEAVSRRALARHERAQNLFERRSITQQQLLDAVTDRDVAEARLASAKLELDKARVTAPWSGQVVSRRVEVGDYAVPGQALVELLDASTLKVRAPAPANDVPFLEVGAPVVVRVEGAGGAEAEGRIVRLGAELDPAARTLDVEAEIPNPDGRLKPGMLARMEVSRRVLEEALLVPVECLEEVGPDFAVYVVEDGVARRRQVETGAVVGRRVVVTEGLEPGARVVVSGQQGLADGQRVVEAG
ncbi:MAG: efflux RND transporter periplasmic adaptor subunit [Acidobacteriota bacterium]|nr:efflux RND transporter periplasmic adaptor subunit [Acidobacteriota bacterium]